MPDSSARYKNTVSLLDGARFSLGDRRVIIEIINPHILVLLVIKSHTLFDHSIEDLTILPSSDHAVRRWVPESQCIQ